MQKEYEKYLDDLPPVVRNVIREADVPKKLQEVAKNYKIHFDKWIPLEEEVMLALVGAKPPELLAKNISVATGLDLITAQTLTDELAEQVFAPINERLQDMLQGGKKRAIETLKQSLQTEEDISYNSNLPSTQRPYSSDDPYREPL